MHGRTGPLWLGAAGLAAVTDGVIVVHGPPPMPTIHGGAVALVAATVWNLVAACRARPTAVVTTDEPPFTRARCPATAGERTVRRRLAEAPSRA
jgi:hypothetical protein